jgi:hypothetical protein
MFFVSEPCSITSGGPRFFPVNHLSLLVFRLAVFFRVVEGSSNICQVPPIGDVDLGFSLLLVGLQPPVDFPGHLYLLVGGGLSEEGLFD